MNKPRIYVDTSVYGGVFDKEFQKPSVRFFEQVRKGVFRLVTSGIVQREVDLAPTQVAKFFDDFLENTEMIPTSAEALVLRKAYLDAKIVSQKYSDDALHVALATFSSCQIIVSWNFKHIVHYDKIDLYNAVNVMNGYSRLAICTPAEVIKYEE